MATCQTCPFFSALAVPQAVNDELIGECRESPPKVFMMPVRTIQGDGIGFDSFHPKVKASHWCGAHPDLVIEDGEEEIKN